MKQRHVRTTGAKKALYRKLVAEHRAWQMAAFEEAVGMLSMAGVAKASVSSIYKLFSGIRIKEVK